MQGGNDREPAVDRSFTCDAVNECRFLLSAESVFSRSLSAMKKERLEAAPLLPGPPANPEMEKWAKASLADKQPVIEQIRQVR